MDIVEVVRVKFQWPGKMYEFSNPHSLSLKRDALVVVEMSNGLSKVGKVAVPPRIKERVKGDRKLMPIVRLGVGTGC